MHDKAPRRRRGKEATISLECIIAKTFPNLGQKTDIQNRKPSEIQIGITQRLTTRYVIIKMSKLKDKKRILKSLAF